MSGETNGLIVPDEIVINKFFHVRNQKVMLDMGLAILYQVETRALKQAVKRNILRFPDDFMFQLTKQEWQEVITICDNLPQTAKYSPATPFAFTEQGVAMLSSVLNSERAIHVNIQIIRIFTKLRLMLTDHTEIRLEIEKIKKSLIIRIRTWRLYLSILTNYWKNKNAPILHENGLDICLMIFNISILNLKAPNWRLKIYLFE